ncbi:MAG TPA: V-type ATPase 116kDa subunit family protein [Nitrososphaera sp.]|jgi:V/A-type H+-transporting ATPase subunit I|nr:V-type ATPase 116kDa subunit family protein [uncultured Nitrososphaera sp.]
MLNCIMGLAKLKKATIILPRMETQAAVSKLAELEWFHPIQAPSASEHINPYYDDLLLKAQKLYQDIDEVIKALGIPAETGVLATMFKGAPKGKTDYQVDNIQGFIADLEDRAAKELEGARKIIGERSIAQKSLEEYSNLKALTENAASLSMDLARLGTLSKFYAGIYVIDSTDEAEIRKSLEDLAVYSTNLGEKKTALTIVGSAEDSERIAKVMRSFGINPLQIPANMPQNPNVAFSEASAKVKELETKVEQLDKEIVKLKASIVTKALSLREAAGVAKDVLETTRKPGGTKNFAIIEGYIPADMESKFKKLAGSDYVSVVEDTGVTIDLQDAGKPTMPTLLYNKGYSKNFEVVTETQGLPRYGETDPTKIISFVWPVFYGLMFADFGHGILLFGLGMLFRIRGNGRLKMWGTLVAASGLAAAVGGLGTGEMFGFHFAKLAVLSGLANALPFIGLLSVAELTFEQVVKILSISIAIGIAHLLMAFILRLRADWRLGHKLMVYTHDIPAIIQYLAVVSLILTAIGAQYDIIGMFLSNKTYGPIPWISDVFPWVTVGMVARAAPPIIFACIAITIIGGMKEEKHLKAEGKESPHGGMVGIVVETVMVRTIEMLANTISYSRLGIMLLVHSALLVTVNNSFEHGGGLAILIGGNIGIMMIEGLIVYIQTIRLHLYEWFPKWYKSDGVTFKKLVPNMLYTNLVWKEEDGKKKQ